MDWGLGRYEHVAAQLRPVAERVVDRLAPDPDAHVLDLGCGTGNATLLLAGRCRRVTGVDPSARLLGVARAAAATDGPAAAFVCGHGGAIPLGDGSLDAVVSVFGVIFAPDAPGAVAEMARVLAPGGRIVLSAWRPEGALAEMGGIRRRALEAARATRDASGMPAGAAASPVFAWYDADTLVAAFAPHRLSVVVEEGALAFEAPSPRDYAEDEFRHHPSWVEARAVLEPLGRWEPVRTAVTRVFADANEDPSAFRITSRYVIATAGPP